jgi:hypothetical protein
LDRYENHSIRTTCSSIKDFLKQRRIGGVRNPFTYTVGKEDTLPVTATKRRITIATLEEKTIEEQNVLKEAHQKKY